MKTEPKNKNPWEAIEDLRVDRDWAYRELAALLNMKLSTLTSAIRRGRGNRRTTAKVEKFLAAQRRAA